MTCTQAHSFTAHGADVLCLAIGPEGTTVFTSGVDQKIVQFTYVPPTTSASSMLNSSVGKWIQTASRRIHSHDVRSLATWPPYTPILASYRHKSPPGSPYVAPILASGGLDMSITLMPALPAHITTSTVATRIVNPIGGNTATTFEDSYFRRLPYRSPVCIARKARLVSCMYETGLKVWRVLNIPSTDMIVDGTDITTDPVTRVGWRRVLEMELNVHTNLVASAISEDGRWLVASDLYETKLFELTASVSVLSTPWLKPSWLKTGSAVDRGCETETRSFACNRATAAYSRSSFKGIAFDWWEYIRIHTRLEEDDHGFCNYILHSRGGSFFKRANCS